MKISTIIHPNAKKQRIETDLMGILHLYVNAPPLEGRANKAAVNMLAKYFNKTKNRVFLIKGEKSKNKIFEIN